MNRPRARPGAALFGGACLALRLAWLCALAACCQTVDLSAAEFGDTKSSSFKKRSAADRSPTYRAQSPGYDSEYAITGGAPPPTATNGAPSNLGTPQAGQVPMGRIGPDSAAGYTGGPSRYPANGYGRNAPSGRTVQYGPPNGPQAKPNAQPYAQPGYAPGGYPPTSGQPAYPPGGYAPGQAYPGGSPPPASPYGPSSPFAPSNGGLFGPGGGGFGLQPAPPGVLPQGANPSGMPGAPGAGMMGGAGPPPLGGYDSQGELFSPSSPFDQPPLQVPINVGVQETTTGRLMFGVGLNSNAGLMGNIVLDEQNFDWRNPPTNWDQVRNGTAFRGGGQQFRIEAMPGTYLSRYGFTFREPYLRDTRINFGLDGYFFNRFYQNWTEQRLGARVSFGYQLTPDLSSSVAVRAERVGISNPGVGISNLSFFGGPTSTPATANSPLPPELTDVLGNNALYSATWTTVHDTRDSPFLPSQGHRLSLELEQAFGTFSFPRAVIGARQHFLLYQRPDGSGRHTLSLMNDTGFTGSHTPIFENFFAGGYNTLRGFYFRGASPVDMGVQVGGKFEFINSVEYMFPITAADALRAVIFTDFGAVEPTTELKWNDFRIAPGIGIRVTIPAMGPAPIALDLAFPIHKSPADQTQIFNFNMGVQR